jgi:hypothetical protein
MTQTKYMIYLASRINVTNWITAIATVVIAWATYVNMVYVGGQLKEMQSTFAIDRAYIYESSVKSESIDLHDNFKIVASFRNFGKTPAIITKTAGICRYSVKLPEPFAALSEDDRTPPLRLPINADSGPFEVQAVARLSDQEIAAANRGIGNVRCIFNVPYEDVRGDEHIAGLCLLWRPNLPEPAMFFCPEPSYSKAYRQTQ